MSNYFNGIIEEKAIYGGDIMIEYGREYIRLLSYGENDDLICTRDLEPLIGYYEYQMLLEKKHLAKKMTLRSYGNNRAPVANVRVIKIDKFQANTVSFFGMELDHIGLHIKYETQYKGNSGKVVDPTPVYPKMVIPINCLSVRLGNLCFLGNEVNASEEAIKIVKDYKEHICSQSMKIF